MAAGPAAQWVGGTSQVGSGDGRTPGAESHRLKRTEGIKQLVEILNINVLS